MASKKMLSSSISVSIILRNVSAYQNDFSKGHVTLKNRVMTLKIQLCHHRNKLQFKIYSKRK